MTRHRLLAVALALLVLAFVYVEPGVEKPAGKSPYKPAPVVPALGIRG
ncbi:MAG TPA: hypothetical protein VEC35_04335 [Noviherbaspirillum sp.]|nr:hypothetical protein [Noviherbaspirillum sp.]